MDSLNINKRDPPPEGAATRVVWGQQESSGGLSRPVTAASLHTTLCSPHVLHAESRQPYRLTDQRTIHVTK
jgi:hypothetical protein